MCVTLCAVSIYLFPYMYLFISDLLIQGSFGNCSEVSHTITNWFLVGGVAEAFV